VALSADGSTFIVGGPGDNGETGAAWVFVNESSAAGTPPTVAAVVNAASYTRAAVSPGGIVTIYGSGMGTGGLTGLQLTPDQTAVTTTLAGVSIAFDGGLAPLIYVSPTQASAVVPYEVSGYATTQVQAVFEGEASAPLTVNVAPALPGIFAVNESGRGGGAILNQDSSLNTIANPAAAGSVVQIFATGEGVTNPASVDGTLAAGQVYPAPVAPVSVTIGAQPATVMYAGAAPGGVAGFLQVNAVVPNGLASGTQPIVLTIGGENSQVGVTVAVR